MADKKKIRIIGVPTDLGASRRGVDMGPSALRVANIGTRLAKLGHEVEDTGNITVAVREAIVKPQANGIKYLPEILAFVAELKERVYQSLKDGRIPLILGGDHSLAIGSIAGVTKFYK